MTELNNNDLKYVSGGSGRERTIGVNVDIPYTDGDVTVKPYVDGELQHALIKVVDASIINLITLRFTGSCGLKNLKVKFNDVKVSNYVLNFDNGSYVKL